MPNRRSHNLRFTDEEWSSLQHHASSLNMSVAGYLRSLHKAHISTVNISMSTLQTIASIIKTVKDKHTIKED